MFWRSGINLYLHWKFGLYSSSNKKVINFEKYYFELNPSMLDQCYFIMSSWQNQKKNLNPKEDTKNQLHRKKEELELVQIIFISMIRYLPFSSYYVCHKISQERNMIKTWSLKIWYLFKSLFQPIPVPSL